MPARPDRRPRHAALRLASVLALLVAGGCGDPGGGSRADGGAAARVASFEPHTFRREHGSCTRDDDDTTAIPCVSVVITSLEVADAATPALADSLRAFVRSAAFASPMEEAPAPGDTAPADAPGVAAALVAEYEEVAAFSPGGMAETWSLEREVAERCQSAGVVSLAAREYRYTGGAHGLETVRLASFDARTGRRLALADLVTDTAAVTAAAERLFRRQQEIPPAQSLEQAGYIFFDDGRFALNSNFVLCADTLTFHYDPYEIAPYALGPIEFRLPLAEIREWVRR